MKSTMIREKRARDHAAMFPLSTWQTRSTGKLFSLVCGGEKSPCKKNSRKGLKNWRARRESNP